ncbi:MAG TPA: putative porin, partial [Chryseolinea sp.]|nr:putative porin [Chryseolinea sp.]
NRFYNKAAVSYENSNLGKFMFFAEDFRYNYHFDKILILDIGAIPPLMHDELNTIGGQYEYSRKRLKGKFTYSNSIAGAPLSNLYGEIGFAVNGRNTIRFSYENLNKIPDHNFNLNQSNYIQYNWFNDFKNEKINTIEVHAITQWANASLQLRTLNDYLFFSNDRTDSIQIVTPKQYDKTINYLSLKVSKEFKYGKFALDNTLLYQKVEQENPILNVPQFTTRNTIYYSNHFFKRALYMQTGVTVNYFTKYYANDYNPLISEFFVQDQVEIGNFPMLDFFINARVRQTRIFLKAEHFNSAFSGNKHYSAPNYPYRDFLIRFGLVWNFFQ